MQLVLFLLAAHFSRCSALIPVCNPAAPAAANHNLFVLCNIGMKMPDSRAGACDSGNVPDKSLLMILSCFSLPVHIYRQSDNAVTLELCTCSDKTSWLVQLCLGENSVMFVKTQRWLEIYYILQEVNNPSTSQSATNATSHVSHSCLQNQFLCAALCCRISIFLKITLTLWDEPIWASKVLCMLASFVTALN